MKKLTALLLTLVLLCGASLAMAEASEPITVDLVENGAWVPFTDYGFQICLPSDWNIMEVSEEAAATGVIFSCQSPEATRSFTVAYSELETESDVQTIGQALAASYENVQFININGIDFVTYDVTANDVTGIATLGDSGYGLYQFVFYPASDAEYGPIAVAIAASISAIEE